MRLFVNIVFRRWSCFGQKASWAFTVVHSLTLKSVTGYKASNGRSSSRMNWKECTRWFKYDRDYFCVNKSQFVPVIFQPPCNTSNKPKLSPSSECKIVIQFNTTQFKYDRDKLWLVYTQSVPVIFEPPCTIRLPHSSLYSSFHWFPCPKHRRYKPCIPAYPHTSWTDQKKGSTWIPKRRLTVLNWSRQRAQETQFYNVKVTGHGINATLWRHLPRKTI
jgi:hypothetical protein